MKSIHDAIAKVKESAFVTKLKSIKNLEIVIAVLLALLAVLFFFVTTAKNKAETGASQRVITEMSEEEERLASVISEISGVGESRVMISYDQEKRVIGVVVVAVGAKDPATRVKMIRCVEKATGASVDRIEIFEMENGG